MGISKTILDQQDDLLQELIRVKDLGDGPADFRYGRQLFHPQLHALIKPGAFNGNGNIVSQGAQDQQVIFMKGLRFIGLYIKYTENLMFNFERQNRFGLSLMQGIDFFVAWFLRHIISNEFQPGLGDMADHVLSQGKTWVANLFKIWWCRAKRNNLFCDGAGFKF